MIGPHNNKELDLLLARKKPMARFTVELDHPELAGDKDFEPYVLAGQIKKHVVRGNYGPPTERRYYYLEGEEWRVKTSEIIYNNIKSPVMSEFTVDDLSRLDGWLLGYAKEDIEHFIRHTNDRKKQR